jgi:hypothetical protein
MMLMDTQQIKSARHNVITRNWPQLLLWPIFFVFTYIFFVSACTSLAKLTSIDTAERLLRVAYILAPNNPNVSSAYAALSRDLGMQYAEKDNQSLMAEYYFSKQRDYFRAASIARPGWPYYALGEYDALIRLRSEPEVIQKQFDRVISIAPNERGIDKGFLKLSILGWKSLAVNQQQWVMTRLADSRVSSSLTEVFEIAEQVGMKNYLCLNLPWGKVRRFCSARANKSIFKEF